MTAPYLTPAEVRDRVPTLADRDATDTQIADAVAEFENVAEQYVGWPLIPRTVTDEQHQVSYGTIVRSTTNAWWPAFVVLNNRKVTAITSVTIDGTTTDSAMYQLDPLGKFLYFKPQIIASILGPKFGLVKVTYTYGLPSLPPEAARATALYVRSTLFADASGTPRDVIGQSMSDGSYTRYSTPDRANGRPTGYIEVDRLLNSLLAGSTRPALA